MDVQEKWEALGETQSLKRKNIEKVIIMMAIQSQGHTIELLFLSSKKLHRLTKTQICQLTLN